MGTITKQLIIFFFILLFISRCANQLPPGGGGLDFIPPEITEVYPVDGTTNFNDDYFEIEFSEYVDKRTFKDALFISPNVEGGLDYEWTGTSVSVEFLKPLDKDVTYTITVGTDLVDLNNKNRMKSSYTFSFSTGNEIDRGTISGRVYSDNTDGILIYAYKVDDGGDTLLNRKPNYVTQTGKDGRFTLNGLGKAKYRLFAVKDEYRDLRYDLDQDLIGVPNQDIILNDIDTAFTGINFKMFKADTTAPRLLKAVMTDEKHILLTLSESVDKKSITQNNFYVVDSTNKRQSDIKYAYKKPGKEEEIILVPDTMYSMNDAVFLFAKELRDTVKNIYFNDFVALTVSDKPDTIPTNIIATFPSLRNATVDVVNTELKFSFDDAFSKMNIQNYVTFTDTLNKIIPFKLNYDDDATIIISPINDLKTEKDYLIKLNLNGFIDAAGNRQDSIYVFRFKTISGLDFTGVSGKILNVKQENNPVLVLENAEDKNVKYQNHITSEDFNFERVTAGKYMLWCYFDADSNYQYSVGWPQPIKYSEQFSVYSDTLKLKPRWVVTDVIFNFK
jgi:Bacterial Ig-like domain